MTHEDDFKGYREPMLGVMKKFAVTVWCEVTVKTTRNKDRWGAKIRGWK